MNTNRDTFKTSEFHPTQEDELQYEDYANNLNGADEFEDLLGQKNQIGSIGESQSARQTLADREGYLDQSIDKIEEETPGDYGSNDDNYDITPNDNDYGTSSSPTA
jgi:hypothetical protein